MVVWRLACPQGQQLGSSCNEVWFLPGTALASLARGTMEPAAHQMALPQLGARGSWGRGSTMGALTCCWICSPGSSQPRCRRGELAACLER